MRSGRNNSRHALGQEVTLQRRTPCAWLLGLGVLLWCWLAGALAWLPGQPPGVGVSVLGRGLRSLPKSAAQPRAAWWELPGPGLEGPGGGRAADSGWQPPAPGLGARTEWSRAGRGRCRLSGRCGPSRDSGEFCSVGRLLRSSCRARVGVPAPGGARRVLLRLVETQMECPLRGGGQQRMGHCWHSVWEKAAPPALALKPGT